MRDPVLFAALTTAVYLAYWLSLATFFLVGTLLRPVMVVLGFPLMLIGPMNLLPFINDDGSRWQLLILLNSFLWAAALLSLIRWRRRTRAKKTATTV